MNRRHAFSIMAIAAAALVAVVWWRWWAARRAVATTARPNVVLISIDTTRADHLGCYGYDRPTTPNLDALAARGVRYARARSQATYTLPSHMSLFTSMVPSHCQINQLTSRLAPDIPTLAEILRNHGYHTTGLVNDAQMNAKLGCNRGFTKWIEFPAQTRDGNCVHISDVALNWFNTAPAEPFFLFLHYYDAHTPYEPPEEFRRRFGSTLAGPDTDRIMRRHPQRRPPNRDPERFKEVIGSYDGAIAWLDSQLARVLDRVPKNTLVVVFGDHGEAFQEHGFTMHGASVYEEEVHVPLLMSMPAVLPEGHAVDDPVMLMDLAPTILTLCGVPAPAHCEGTDLSPTWSGTRLPERTIVAETKMPLEGQAVKMVLLNEWKLVRSLMDGQEELYRLPDEQTDLSRRDTPVRQFLSDTAHRWIAEEDFWMVYARGPGQFSANLTPKSGQYVNVIPFGGFRDDDHYDFHVNGWSLGLCWRVGDGTRSLFIQVVPTDAANHFDFQVDGQRRLNQVFIGTSQAHPPKLPFDLSLEGAETSGPIIDRPFHPDKPGFYVFRHRASAPSAFPALAGRLDQQAIQQLRSLGYLR